MTSMRCIIGAINSAICSEGVRLVGTWQLLQLAQVERESSCARTQPTSALNLVLAAHGKCVAWWELSNALAWSCSWNQEVQFAVSWPDQLSQFLQRSTDHASSAKLKLKIFECGVTVDHFPENYTRVQELFSVTVCDRPNVVSEVGILYASECGGLSNVASSGFR